MTAVPVCGVCGELGTVTVKPLNGLPKGVVACEGCRQAVKGRQVGIVVRADGTLSITDGRNRESESERDAILAIPGQVVQRRLEF